MAVEPRRRVLIAAGALVVATTAAFVFVTTTRGAGRVELVPCLGPSPCVDASGAFALQFSSSIAGEQGKLMISFPLDAPCGNPSESYPFAGVYAVVPRAGALTTVLLSDPSLECVTANCRAQSARTVVLNISDASPVILLAQMAEAPILLSARVWYSSLEAYVTRTAPNEQNSLFGTTVFEFSLDCNRKAYTDVSYMAGLSTTFAATSSQGWDGGASDPTCAPVPFASDSELVWGKDPRTHNLMVISPLQPLDGASAYDCSAYTSATPFAQPDPSCFDNVVAREQCPSQLANDPCGQHACRLEMYKYARDTKGYCYWLNALSGCDGYCWAMAEFDCTDADCGYAPVGTSDADRPSWGSNSECGTLAALAQSNDPPNANAYSCGTSALPNANGGDWWTEGVGCASSTTNPGRSTDVAAAQSITVTIDRPSGAGWTPSALSTDGVCVSDGSTCDVGSAVCSCCHWVTDDGDADAIWQCPGSKHCAATDCAGGQTFEAPTWVMTCPFPSAPGGQPPTCVAGSGQMCPGDPATPGSAPVPCPSPPALPAP